MEQRDPGRYTYVGREREPGKNPSWDKKTVDKHHDVFMLKR
jgi:hypothetical protein